MRFLLLALLLAGAPAALLAGSWDPLTSSNWEDAQTRGGVVLLEFSTADCRLCGVQKNALRQILTSDLELPVTGLQLNLGSDLELEQRYAVKIPGTLLLLRGGHELSRSIGTVSEEELRSFIAQAFMLKRWASPKIRPSNRLPFAP